MRSSIQAYLLALLVLGTCSSVAQAGSVPPMQPPYTLVIIIDDLGNQLDSGARAIALPGKLNFAILPHTPKARELAEMAAAAGKEVLLHAPMSNSADKALGPGALTGAMSEQVFRQTLLHSISSTPHVRGVSNHMGSQLTEQRVPMQWTMQELARQDLYFVDSRTSAQSVAASVAAEYHIPSLTRHVFLDNEQTPIAVHRQFQELLERARGEGLAVAIGHPYPVTLHYLQQVLPGLAAQGFQLALVSEVLASMIPAPRLEQLQMAPN